MTERLLPHGLAGLASRITGSSVVAYTLDDSGGAAVHYDRSLGH